MLLMGAAEIEEVVNVAVKSRRRGLLKPERLSLSVGLVDTEWFSLCFSWFFLTLTNGCVVESVPYSYCCTLQAVLAWGRSHSLKETAAF